MSCNDDEDNLEQMEPTVSINGEQSLTAYQKSTVEVTAKISAKNGTPEITANGETLSLSADSTVTYSVEVPFNAELGEAIDVKFTVKNGDAEANLDVVKVKSPDAVISGF